MKSKQKYIILVAILILFTFVISACSTGSGDRDFTRTYDLRLEVAGDGLIRDAQRNEPITASSRTLEPERNTIVELEAVPFTDGDFFSFWTANYQLEFQSDTKQSIYMDNNKELIAVFGDPEKLYMAGDITEAWGHQNVMGFWKAIVGNEDLEGDEFKDGTIELYVRETIGQERRYRYIFDNQFDSGGLHPGKIDYHLNPINSSDVSSNNYEYEYFAAIMRVEESADLERLLFVYSDEDYIDILILPERPPFQERYEYITEEFDLENDNEREEFRNQIIQAIEEFKEEDNAEYMTGNALDFNNPFETQ